MAQVGKPSAAVRTGSDGDDLAQRLASAGRLPEADALWNALGARVDGLPESATKIQALVARTAFVERTGADELILGGSIYDQQARHRSLRLVAEALS